MRFLDHEIDHRVFSMNRPRAEPFLHHEISVLIER
jgi:hypothetical protein